MQQEQVQLIYVSCLYRGCTLVQSPYKLQLKYFMKIFRSIHEIMFVSARMSHLISANYSLFPDTSRPCNIFCNTTTNQAEKQITILKVSPPPQTVLIQIYTLIIGVPSISQERVSPYNHFHVCLYKLQALTRWAISLQIFQIQPELLP